MTEETNAAQERDLEATRQALMANRFEAVAVEDGEAARDLVIGGLIPVSGAGSVAFGGSMTVAGSGIYAAVKKLPGLSVIDTLDHGVSREELLERRRQALLCDLFLTGTNAVTRDGRLVNLDMTGNRVGGLHFGPKKVIVVVGRNKIVDDLPAAIDRVKTVAAPANAKRLNKKTPCVKTGVCQDCKSPERICNVWTVTEKSFPPGRICVVLINRDLGL